MRSTPTSLRRAVAAAVAVPVLALSAVACSGDGGDDAREPDRTERTGQDTGGGEGGDGGKEDTSLPPLSKAQLEKALLADGDVPGYRAQRNPEDPLPTENTIEPDRPECEAITDAVDSRPAHERTAYTSGVVMKGDLGTGGVVQQVLLSAYRPGEAASWLDELEKALDECQRFTGKVGTGEQADLEIEPEEPAGIGDDSVQFTMKDAKGKDSPTVFTIVRAGDNTATFMAIGVAGEARPVAKPVMVEQHRKLVTAGGGDRR